MRQSKAALAVIAVLMAAVSVSVFARGHSVGRGGGHGGHGGYASSGARASSGHVGSRPSIVGHVGSRPSFVGRVGSRPAFVGHARVGMFIGAPLYAPLVYPAPDFYYSPAPVYIEQAPTPAYWYFCPESNAYYPHVQECPSGWQPILPQPSGPDPQLPG